MDNVLLLFEILFFDVCGLRSRHSHRIVHIITLLTRVRFTGKRIPVMIRRFTCYTVS